MKYSPSYYANFLYETKNVGTLIELLKKHWVLSWLPRILEEFDTISDKKEGAVRVTVKSAYPLDKAIEGEIERVVAEEEKGRKIRTHFVIDKSVIGGFRAESDEMLISASLAERLRQLEINFTICTRK